MLYNFRSILFRKSVQNQSDVYGHEDPDPHVRQDPHIAHRQQRTQRDSHVDTVSLILITLICRFVDTEAINHLLQTFRDVDDLLTSGTQVEKLVVLHPAIVPVEAQLVYVAYNGWIYSGRLVSRHSIFYKLCHNN